jgi:hypothetical protein
MPVSPFYTAVGVLLLIFTLSLAPDGSEMYSGPSQHVDASFFGLHIHRAAAGTPWPGVQFSHWRLWDAGVSWPQLEAEPGKWNFRLLDDYAQIAAERHVDILLTLGLTPGWASARPDEPSAYSNGNAAEPRRIADWEEYVRFVATRYRGRIHEYEIWNEPNVKGTFTGSAETMAELARAAYRVLKSVDPSIIVVSPAATAQQGVGWLDEFLRHGGCESVDVIGYHLYVTPQPPEAMLTLVRAVRKVLQRRGCDNKPLWSTESGWAEPKRFSSDEDAAAYLMRTYLLNWLLGVQRCYWYAWDNRNWSTLDLTARSGEMTGAGAAYGVVRQWMLGAALHGCDRSTSGLWTCQLDRENTITMVLWSENGTQSFAIPASWQAQTTLNWRGESSHATSKLSVGSSPVALISSRMSGSGSSMRVPAKSQD